MPWQSPLPSLLAHIPSLSKPSIPRTYNLLSPLHRDNAGLPPPCRPAPNTSQPIHCAPPPTRHSPASVLAPSGPRLGPGCRPATASHILTHPFFNPVFGKLTVLLVHAVPPLHASPIPPALALPAHLSSPLQTLEHSPIPSTGPPISSASPSLSQMPSPLIPPLSTPAHFTHQAFHVSNVTIHVPVFPCLLCPTPTI